MSGLVAMFRRTFIAALFLSATLVVPSAYAQEAMGTVAALSGSPSATGEAGSRRLTVGGAVFEGDRITVGPGGNAQLILSDGTKLVVGPSSQLLLQSQLLRNASTAKKISVKGLRGTFRFITGNSPKSAYDISTSNATIGIRGTAFDFNVGNRTVLAVLNGAVKLKGSNGKSVNTEAGCSVAEAGPGSVIARELDGTNKTDELNDLPYIIDQSGLESDFQLDTAACLPFFPTNTGSGFAPSVPTVIVPLVTVPPIIYVVGEVLDEENDPASENGNEGDGECSNNPNGEGPDPNDPDCIITIDEGD
jgi:hypothetical protein